MWSLKTVLICSCLLHPPCSSLSKSDDFDDMLLGEPPDRAGWVDPFNMGDLEDHQKIVGTTQSTKNSQVDTARVLDILGEIVDGQKDILLAVQSNNATIVDCKVVLDLDAAICLTI